MRVFFAFLSGIWTAAAILHYFTDGEIEFRAVLASMFLIAFVLGDLIQERRKF